MLHNYHFLALIAIICALSACVAPPKFPDSDCSSSAYRGMILLNEGNWGPNNASIDIFAENSFEKTTDIFSCVNKKPLGSLGNDMLRVADTLYVAMNGSGIIYKIQLPNFSILKELRMDNSVSSFGASPYKIAEKNGKLYCSSLGNPFLYVIQSANLEILTTIPVENYQYGIAISGKYAFVACGNHYPVTTNKNHKVAVIDTETDKLRQYISLPLDNTDNILTTGDTLIVNCRGDYTPRDTASAIFLLNAKTFEMLHAYYFPYSTFSPCLVENYLFAAQDSGILRISLASQKVEKNFLRNASLNIQSGDYVNGISYNAAKAELYFLIMKNGGNSQIWALDPYMNVLRTLEGGIFAKKLLFYE